MHGKWGLELGPAGANDEDLLMSVDHMPAPAKSNPSDPRSASTINAAATSPLVGRPLHLLTPAGSPYLNRR